MSLSHSQPGRRTNEELFFSYYPRLLEWASQITHRDQAEAEDLVHDFYLRVSRISRSLDEVEQLERYLFRVLRNLYYSRLRRAGRDPLNDLCIVDYDSIEQGLASADRRELLFARAHLRQVCRYACQRKSTARSASVLILRFFLGYYPAEVMKILRASRVAVDRSLQIARQEARLFLERPDVLRSIVPKSKPSVSFTMDGEDTQELFLELQEAIFSAAEGECLDREVLEQRYGGGGEQAGLTTQELSHLVSCRTCLDQVNAILHLPLLAERSPEDGIYRDKRSGPGGDGGSGATRTPKKPAKKEPPTRKLERHARQLFEHRPGSLKIVVDGDVRTSQRVTAERNELQLALGRKEEPSFIEVLSEQGFCLAYLQVVSPDSADQLEQAETASFSDNRSLVLTLSFASEVPIIHVLYRDPLMSEAENAQEEPLPAFTSFEVIPDVSAEATESRREPSLVRSLREMLSRIGERFFDGPAGYAVVLGSLASLVLGFFMLQHQASSPTDLLQRAVVVENAAHPGEAIHREIEITELSDTDAALETQRVDLWKESGTANVARRLYDSDGKLQSEELSNSENGTVLYRKEGVTHSGPVRLDSASAADVWRLAPSATGMQDAAKLASRSVATQADSYAVDARSSQPEGLTEARLVLRKSDLHATEETVTFRESGRVRSFRLVEAVYERVPMRQVKPGIFAPDPEWASPTARSRNRSSLTGINPLGQFTPELAVHVLYQLSEIGADLGGQTEITRQPHGLIVSGTLDSAAKKSELLRSLANTKDASAVQVNVSVAGESAPRLRRGAGHTSLKMIESGADVIPADAVLRRVLAVKGVAPEQMDEAVRDFSRQATRLSLNARMQAWALSSALNLLSPQEVRELSPEGRREWLTIIDRHATALQAALDDLKTQLSPLRETAPGAATNPPEIQSAEDMTVSAAQILSLVNAQDSAICSALMLSPQAPAEATQSFEPSQFWSSMDRLIALSTSVQQTAQTLEAAIRSPEAR